MVFGYSFFLFVDEEPNIATSSTAGFVGGCFLGLVVAVGCWLVVQTKTRRTPKQRRFGLEALGGLRIVSPLAYALKNKLAVALSDLPSPYKKDKNKRTKLTGIKL
jgi:hypothetical protein